MRYDNWDVLLFPPDTEAKVPLKEFKVVCHVVPDPELSHMGNVGIPVTTCFVPGLQPGTPFRISIHSWDTPKISQFTRSYSKHIELIKLEARVLIDGRMVTSKVFGSDSSWPLEIDTMFDISKHGESSRLRFPHFREELLYQNHWRPGDDLGRIKVIISEGFPRDSLSVPIERIKNVVAFSFQHAPLDLLESNGIAWPNPSMWKRVLPPPTTSTTMGGRYHRLVANAHAHTPRYPAQISVLPSVPMLPSQAGNLLGPSAFQMPFSSPNDASDWNPSDPFSDAYAYIEYLNSMSAQPGGKIKCAGFEHSRHLASDESMSDYAPTPPPGPDAMLLSGESLEDEPVRLKAPTNTPTTGIKSSLGHIAMHLHDTSTIPMELATSLTHSLLNQPAPIPVLAHNVQLPAAEVKSRKENKHLALPDTTATSESPSSHADAETRKASLPTFHSGSLARLGSASSRIVPGSTSPSFASRRLFSTGVSRTPSAGEFGAPITNLVTTPSPQEASEINFTKGMKRAFTPASAQAIDNEDEPRRASPQVNITMSVSQQAKEN